MVDHRDPDPALTDGKGFPLKMFALTVTEIEVTTVRSANVPVWRVTRVCAFMTLTILDTVGLFCSLVGLF
jgi:hypothetical protein